MAKKYRNIHTSPVTANGRVFKQGETVEGLTEEQTKEAIGHGYLEEVKEEKPAAEEKPKAKQ